MPLINDINGGLLRRLSAASSSATPSTVSGRGVSTSFEGDSVNLSSGLSVVATAFSDSYVRVSAAVSRIDLTQNVLSSLGDLANQLYQLATESADVETTTEDRGRLVSEYQSALGEFQKTISDASKLTDDVFGDSIDLLDSGDLADVLRSAGIDLSAATVLGEAFSEVGGSDADLGYERVVLEDGTEVDPLAQVIDTRENALLAKDALGSLKEVIAADRASVGGVLEELRAAQKFAFQGAISADDLSGSVLDSASADLVADRLVAKIKQQTSDTAIGPHSSLDTALARDLLSD